jgi:hypothetical protein
MTHRKAHAEHAPDKSDAHSIGDGSDDQLLVRGIVWRPFWATPSYGRGATFHFSFPTATEAAEAPRWERDLVPSAP